MTHVITDTQAGLLLEVDGAPIALIRDRQGCRDLVWTIRGPQDLDTAREAIMGLLDLLVHYDALGHGPIVVSHTKGTVKSRFLTKE